MLRPSFSIPFCHGQLLHHCLSHRTRSCRQRVNDWYHCLRTAIPSVRVMSRPKQPDGDRPAFHSCSKSRLLRCLTYINSTIVSPFIFFLSILLINRPLFLYSKGTLTGTQTSCWILSSLALFALSRRWSFTWMTVQFLKPGLFGLTARLPLLPSM